MHCVNAKTQHDRLVMQQQWLMQWKREAGCWLNDLCSHEPGNICHICWETLRISLANLYFFKGNMDTTIAYHSSPLPPFTTRWTSSKKRKSLRMGQQTKRSLINPGVVGGDALLMRGQLQNVTGLCLPS